MSSEIALINGPYHFLLAICSNRVFILTLSSLSAWLQPLKLYARCTTSYSSANSF